MIALSGKLPKRHANLALHKSDLNFAAQCLHAINSAPEEPSVIRESLWRSAIIFYVKCFSAEPRAKRGSLTFKAVYKNDAMAKRAFRYFLDLRNKHLVHDENPWSQGISAAVLNHADGPTHIERVVCIAFNANTLTQDNYSNLERLVREASSYVDSQLDTISDRLTEELESKAYDELAAMGPPIYHAPNVEQIRATRDA